MTSIDAPRDLTDFLAGGRRVVLDILGVGEPVGGELALGCVVPAGLGRAWRRECQGFGRGSGTEGREGVEKDVAAGQNDGKDAGSRTNQFSVRCSGQPWENTQGRNASREGGGIFMTAGEKESNIGVFVNEVHVVRGSVSALREEGTDGKSYAQ